MGSIRLRLSLLPLFMSLQLANKLFTLEISSRRRRELHGRVKIENSQHFFHFFSTKLKTFRHSLVTQKKAGRHSNSRLFFQPEIVSFETAAKAKPRVEQHWDKKAKSEGEMVRIFIGLSGPTDLLCRLQNSRTGSK